MDPAVPFLEAHHLFSEAVPAKAQEPPAPQLFLPIETREKVASPAELAENVELRAYKLGKKRWLYNEAKVNIVSESGLYSPLEVTESTFRGADAVPETFQECGAGFIIKVKNCSLKLELDVYVALDKPHTVEQVGVEALGFASMPPVAGYKWPPVSRRQCQKKCSGMILRSIMRYGRASRRTAGKKAKRDVMEESATEPAEPEDRAKDPRHLYLSIDEASTHVGGSNFRLIAAAFDPTSRALLGTCCSLPISVVANNDAPNGPAMIDLNLKISDSWEGWSLIRDPAGERNASTESQRDHYRFEGNEASNTVQGVSNHGSYRSVNAHQEQQQNLLTYIRGRPYSSAAEDDMDTGLPASKRHGQLPGFGLEAEDTVVYANLAPQLTASDFSASLSGPFDRWQDCYSVDRGTTEAARPQLHDRSGAHRLHSGTDSTYGAVGRHSSLPTDLTRLSPLVEVHAYRSTAPSALQQNSHLGQLRFNSVPYQSGGLQNELYSHRMPSGHSVQESRFWKQQAQIQGQTFCSHGSAVGQGSTSAALLKSGSDASPPRLESDLSGSLVQQAQNPGLSVGFPGANFNPFADKPSADEPPPDHDAYGEDLFWHQQAQRQQGHDTAGIPDALFPEEEP